MSGVHGKYVMPNQNELKLMQTRERFPQKIKRMAIEMLPDEESRTKLVMKMVQAELDQKLNNQE